MDITISYDGGTFFVRDSCGGLQQCKTQEQAVSYANGLADGFNAARSALSVARWQMASSARLASDAIASKEA